MSAVEQLEHTSNQEQILYKENIQWDGFTLLKNKNKKEKERILKCELKREAQTLNT